MASIRKAKLVKNGLKNLDKKSRDKIESLTNSLLAVQKTAEPPPAKTPEKPNQKK